MFRCRAQQPAQQQQTGGKAMKKKTTSNRVNTFKAEDFSSRKLLDLVDEAPSNGRRALDRESLQAAISELASRRHYLQELRDRGLLAPRSSR